LEGQGQSRTLYFTLQADCHDQLDWPHWQRLCNSVNICKGLYLAIILALDTWRGIRVACFKRLLQRRAHGPIGHIVKPQPITRLDFQLLNKDLALGDSFACGKGRKLHLGE